MPLSTSEVRGLRDAVINHGSSQAFSVLYSNGQMLYPEPKTRAFGVEAEFFGIERGDAVRVLRQAGINAQDDGYHHTPRRYWRITEDGSVSNEANELVSPILRFGKSDLTVTNMVVSLLRANGGRVDNTCGLHIHHNANGMRVPDIVEMVCHYALFQPLINRVLSLSRRGDNGYARAIYSPFEWERGVLRAADSSFTSLCHNASRTFGRFHAVNLAALSDHGSVEFRQHQGTLNGEKISAWVEFTKLFMRVGPRGSSYRTLIDTFGSESSMRSEMGLTGMLEYMGASNKLIKYYVLRAEELEGRLGMSDPEDADSRRNAQDDGEPPEGAPDENGRGRYCGSCGSFHYDDDDYDENDENPVGSYDS